MSKPPTPQAISALLRKAGYEKAVMTNNSRYHKEHTAGFHVFRLAGEICVAWWAASTLNTERTTAVVAAERAEQRRTLLAYAEVIRAGGWAVRETLSLGILSVTAKEDGE